MENIMRSVFSITINERKNMSNILQYFLNLHAHTILFLHFHVKFICIFWNFLCSRFLLLCLDMMCVDDVVYRC